ncbi:MAG TPA: carboxypeptidase-like regulatory domain-containing protein [Chryseosolibacter sp.]
MNCFKEEMFRVFLSIVVMMIEVPSVFSGYLQTNGQQRIGIIQSEVKGTIIDAQTSQPIPYASILYKKSKIGTVADEVGNFAIQMQAFDDTLSVTAIGYRECSFRVTPRTPSADLKNISLTPTPILLKEVMVTGEKLSAVSIIRKVIDRFEKNFTQHSYVAHQIVSRRIKTYDGKLVLIENHHNKTDHNGYQFNSPYPNLNEVSIEQLKSFAYVVDTITFDTISSRQNVTVVAPIGFIDILNFRKNTFLNKSKLRDFNFDISEVIVRGENELYKITFGCEKPNHYNTLQLAPISFSGELFINSADFAVERINIFALNDREKIHNAERMRAYTTKEPWYTRVSCTYKKTGEYYFLDECILFSNWDYEDGFVKVANIGIKY